LLIVEIKFFIRGCF